MNKKILIGIIILVVLVAGFLLLKKDKPSPGGIVVGPPAENANEQANAQADTNIDNAPDTEFAPLDTADSDFGEIDAAIDSFE